MTEPRSEDVFNWGFMNAMQDRCENCPFASSGGMDKRTAMEAPDYVPKDQTEEYLRGYRAYCEDNYGEGWETAQWGWAPALKIDPKDGSISVPDGKGGWTEVRNAGQDGQTDEPGGGDRPRGSEGG